MSKYKKIAFVLPDLRGGGAEKVFVTLANYFVSIGYVVEMVLLKEKGEFLTVCDKNITIVDLNCHYYRDSIIPLRNYISKNKPSSIIVGLWPLTSYAVLANLLTRHKAGIIVTDHSILSKSPVVKNIFKLIFLRLSIFFLYPFARSQVGVSNGVCNDLMRLSFGRVVADTIYNPVERLLVLKDKSHPLGGRKYILSVGRLKAVKDYPNLIKGFALVQQELVDLHLVILGDGELKAELTDLIKSLGLVDNVHLMGFKRDLYRWYYFADLFVLSSINEGFGNVLVEAMQFGLPIVSTDCESGPREILADGKYGELVPVGDFRALAAACIRGLKIARDPSMLRERASEFSIEKIGKQYLNRINKTGNI